jgi:hypothetical protein
MKANDEMLRFGTDGSATRSAGTEDITGSSSDSQSRGVPSTSTALPVGSAPPFTAIEMS